MKPLSIRVGQLHTGEQFVETIFGSLECGNAQRVPFDEMPEDARNLFYLTLSLAEVAPAVELFRQPTVIDGYDVKRFSMKRREVRAQRA